MRELAKSMVSFSWALSLLGVKQAANLLNPAPGQPRVSGGDAFESMKETAVRQLDDSLKGVFRTGDNMQKRFVDTFFSMMWPANRGCSVVAKPDQPEEASGTEGTAKTGWGPMPG